MWGNGFENIYRLQTGKSRSINWENRTGEKGKGGMAAGDLGPSRKGSPCIPLVRAGETVTLAEMDGPGIIRHIWITVTDRTSDRNRYVLRDLVLRMYWDGEENPSVESPLGDLFCCGFGVSYPVNSLPVAVNPTRGFNLYFPMPFRKKARITLENQCDEDVHAFFYQVDYCLTGELPEDAGYFHAQWRRQRLTEKGKDYVILDGVKGKGQYVGTYLALTTLERYWYGEGEVKFYLDGDTDYPTICGTGTEDYFGGAGASRRRSRDGRWKTPSVRLSLDTPTIPHGIPSCITITIPMISCPSAASTGGTSRIRFCLQKIFGSPFSRSASATAACSSGRTMWQAWRTGIRQNRIRRFRL